MKKYIILFSATVLSIAAILLVGFTTEEPCVEVTARQFSKETVELSLTCDGVVGPKNRYNIYASLPCVVERITVKEGDAVQKGDVLFTVNAEATRTWLKSTGKYSEEQRERAANQCLVSPVNGVITSVNAGEGGTVDSSKPSFTLSGTDELEITVEIPEKKLRSVYVGQEVSVSGSGFDKEEYHGRVTRLSSLAHMTGTETMVSAVVALEPEELDASLRLGLSAKARLITDRLLDRLVIPYEMVLEDEGNREYVYVIRNHRAVRQYITTEAELSTGVLVSEGLTEEDRVICQPQDIPQDGVSVTELTEE